MNLRIGTSIVGCQLSLNVLWRPRDKEYKLWPRRLASFVGRLDDDEVQTSSMSPEEFRQIIFRLSLFSGLDETVWQVFKIDQVTHIFHFSSLFGNNLIIDTTWNV